MSTSQLVDAIRKWTEKNGRGPTFDNLHQFFGGSDDTLVEELDKALKANIIGRHDDRTYYVV